MADDGRREGSDPAAAKQVTARTRPVDARAPTELPSSEVLIDRFVVLGELGKGGMGVVYSARDPDLDRTVAIKLLHFDEGIVRARLLREAQAMARIDHPNVVKVYEVGTHGDGVYVAMELAKAGTLRGWLAARPRTQREIIAAFVQAGRGLAAAHAVGLIHRDFTPDNVLMTSHETAKVTDFGLVAEQGVAEPSPEVAAARVTPLSLKLTRTGTVMGTPAYMAPEQFNGEPTTARTDQFAFCIALCEAVAGARPFKGATFEELGVNVTAGEMIARPANVPVWLWRIVARGLALDPAARFPSMDELLAELERGRWSRRHRIVAGAAAVVIGAGASLGVIAAMRPRHAAPPAIVTHSARNLTAEPGCEEYPSFTPDGREVVFDGVVDNDLELEAITIDTGARRRLTHAPGWDLGAAVSPDGRHVAYVHAGRELRVVGIEGDAKAPPRTIGLLHGFPAWTHDGDVLYSGLDGQIYRAPVDGPPASIARVPGDAKVIFLDEFPDGEIVLALNGPTGKLAMAHLRPGGVVERYEPRWETLDSTAIRVDRAGRGVYYVDLTPTGLPKLHWRARDGGDPIVLEGTRPVTNSFAIASSGRTLAISQCEGKHRVGRMRGGGFEPLANISADWLVSAMAVLPDDQLIVSAHRSADSELHLWKVTAAGADEVVNAPADLPAVSRDGGQLAWSGATTAEPGIHVRAAAGGPARRLTLESDDGPLAFSHDGTNVLFVRGRRVYSVPVAGGPVVAVTPPGVVGFAVAPDRPELAVLFDDGERGVLRTGPAGGPFDEVRGLAPRNYDEVAFDREGMLLGTPASLHAVGSDGSERLLWTATVETLLQVAPSRTGGDPWAIVTGYDGDLALVEGEFP